MKTVFVLSPSNHGDCYVTHNVYIIERVAVAAFFSLAVFKKTQREKLRDFQGTILVGGLL